MAWHATQFWHSCSSIYISLSSSILKTLTILRLRKGVKVLQERSLVGLLNQQGEHIALLVVEILLNLSKVWSDMGNSACLPFFMYLTTVQICAYSVTCYSYRRQGIDIL